MSADTETQIVEARRIKAQFAMNSELYKALKIRAIAEDVTYPELLHKLLCVGLDREDLYNMTPDAIKPE